MNEVKRVRYFEYEFLDAEDFKVEQDYHRGMRYKHNRDFHTLGIGGGLEVNFAEGQEKGNETKVTVRPGTAVDGEGREIVLARSKTIDFNQPGYEGGRGYYITINWHEQPGLPGQQNELKRWEETPEIDTSEVFPGDPGINLVLAKVTLRQDENKTIESIDNLDRRYAAIEIGDNTVSSTKIVKADGTSGQDTNRGDGIKTDHIQDEAVTVDKLGVDVHERMQTIEQRAIAYVDELLVGTVAAFAFETLPENCGWLECNGQAVSRTEYARLFKCIGLTFGSGDGATTFNVPDLRGRFVRGWAHESQNDPDRNNRTASATGGVSGDHVGSYQNDALQEHRHNFEGTNAKIGGGSHNHIWALVGDAELFSAYWTEGNNMNTNHPRNAYTNSVEHSHDFTPSGSITNPTSCRIASESRPKNLALMYCIKY